jgi:predicted signal transduction protein with EAL and GGDEF domain
MVDGRLCSVRASWAPDFVVPRFFIPYSEPLAFVALRNAAAALERLVVEDLTTRNDSLAIIRAVAGLGKNLGIATTAEGVERSTA